MRREMRYENRRKVRKPARKARAAATAGALLLAGLVAGWPASLWAAADDDICGCAESPSLGDFDSTDENTWPEGTTKDGSVITIPLEFHQGGVLVFDSLTFSNNWDLEFVPNEANDPVTLLVKGDVTVCVNCEISVSGRPGGAGSTSVGPGQGGLGGPGGYAGGGGALAAQGFGGHGTAGIGPGAGHGGVAGVDKVSSTVPTQATWLGVPELRPLSGGSGGGGGWSITDDQWCAGGGGGGGGGALLIAANGTIELTGGTALQAKGGKAGVRANSGCASSGSSGSGGAIRLVAKTITGGGSISAEGGALASHDPRGPAGGRGSIRIEGDFEGYTGSTTPSASRSNGRSPLVSPLIPSVVIVAIDGNPPPALPQGFRGGIDLDVTAGGQVLVELQSTDVPSGTQLLVKATPKAGGLPVVETRAIAPESCGLGGAAAGVCDTTVEIDLVPGAYIVEARATFQVPSP
ncbi:MAG: hypothetical protein VX546_08120 [Myxococcota bacterium]|nr:hypothetical protein [Myxococcota bacterium]